MSLKGVAVMGNMCKWILTVSALLMMTEGAYGRDLWDLKKDELLLVRIEQPEWSRAECVRTLAFIPFEKTACDSDGRYKPQTDWGIEVTEGVAQGLWDESGAYGIELDVIDPEAVDKALRVKKFAKAGLPDERMAVELGRKVQAQAVVYGRVDVDIQTVGERGRAYWVCPAKAGVEIKTVRNLVRKVTVTLKMKIVSTATGQCLFAYNRGFAETSEFQPKLYATAEADQPESEAVERIVRQMVKDVVAQLVPRAVYQKLKTEGVDSKPAKMARKYLLSGDVGRAITLFCEGVQIEPDDDGAWYNLGLAYEIVGSLTEARKAYERAYWIDDEDEYLEAIRRIDACLGTAKPTPCLPTTR